MNKKAQANEMTWLVGIFLYFIFLIGIVTAVYGAATYSLEDYNSSLQTADFDRLSADHICSNPRYYYDLSSGEAIEYKKRGTDRLYCDESIGIKSNITCQEINGCSWDEVTTGWWLWESSSYRCEGIINASHYLSDEDENITRVSAHNETGFWERGFNIFNDPSPCTHPDLLFNKSSCDVFSCTWSEYDFMGEINSASAIKEAFGDVFSFRHNFGISGILGFIVQSLFVWIPLLMLIIAIIKMLPFT